MAALAGFTGCEDAARHTAAHHPVQSPTPASQGARVARVVHIDPLPLDPARRSRVRVLSLGRPDGPRRVEQQVQASFAAGQVEYKAGHLDVARQEFDHALSLLSESGFDLGTNPRLDSLRQQIVAAEHDAQTVSANGDAFTEPNTQPAPMDEIAASAAGPGEPAEAPIDPLLRTRAETELAGVAHDLPLMVNDIVLSYLNFFQTPRGRAIVETGLRRAGRYRPMIEKVLHEEGLPSDLIYMAQAESAFQPQALSSAGARGLWQFMSFRGKQYGLEHSWWVDDRQDPEKATRAAAHHLRDLYKMFGDWYLVMAAYDSGPGTVQHAVERTGYADFWQLYKMNALPKETRDYVPIILALTLIAKDPARYGVEVDPQEPLRTDDVQPGHPLDLRLVAESMEVDLETLRLLNPQLLRLVTPADPAFVLHLPAGTADRFRTEMAAIPEDKWASWRQHRVADGETLSAVAQQYHVSAAAIADANGLAPRAVLEAGTKLVIPVSPQSQATAGKLLRYRGRQNDTVESVADEFDVSAADLRKWNHLRGNQAVHAMRLKIYLGGSGAPPADTSSREGTSAPAKSRLASGAATSATRNVVASSETSTLTPAKTGATATAKISPESLSSQSDHPGHAGQPGQPGVRTQTAARARETSPQAQKATAEQHSAIQPVVHHVLPGETLYSIARSYQTTVEALRSGNRFLLSRSLEAGDTLKIPASP